MQLTDFDYDLPERLIAQRPLPQRDEARLLVLERVSGRITGDIFRNIGTYLPPQALLVANNSRVIPARLLGVKPRSGGQVEVFLLKQIDDRRFEAMLRPLKMIRENELLEFPGGITARLADRTARIVVFDGDNVLGRLKAAGHIPLPPYIKRPDEDSDRTDYQTVYAKEDGSVAAPTAGLHFTDDLLSGLQRAGHAFAEVTLHVGYGTFKPVETENIVDHPMHHEDYVIPPATLDAVRSARAAGQKVAAVGTTSCRVLESWARTGEEAGATRLFLYPGARFQVVDALITNFHLPRSTLLMLVSAFAGTDLVRRAYAEAIRREYRFYSYGDAMLIL